MEKWMSVLLGSILAAAGIYFTLLITAFILFAR